MHTPNQPSPMLKAIDLIRVNIDELHFPEIETHAVEVLDTIAALNDYINGALTKSHNALLNAHQLSRKLCLHMARVRDLINARKAAQAFAQSAHAINMSHLPRAVPAMKQPSRVIRPLKSADNAASGPIELLWSEPTAQSTKAQWGGEAKEVPSAESLAKPDGERSERGGRQR